MILTLTRRDLTPDSTIGELYIDNVFECWTLEDTLRKEKIAGKTAIPFGTYNVILSYSPRFGRILPLIINVPGFDGIRIHPGNTSRDTEGCILVGTSYTKDVIFKSREAFTKLFAKLKEADKIVIEIK